MTHVQSGFAYSVAGSRRKSAMVAARDSESLAYLTTHTLSKSPSCRNRIALRDGHSWDNTWPEIREEMRRKRGEVQMSPTALQEYMRQEEEWRQEVKRIQLAAVQKAGYSSLEAATEALLKKHMEHEVEARKRVEEETDHPIPMFCVKSLVDYRTQDAPDLASFFQAKAEEDMQNLIIDPSYKSKRLSPEVVVQHWERDTQKASSSEWPAWLKADPVLCRIEQQNEHGDYQEERKRLPEREARHSSPWSTFTEDRSDVEMSNATRPSTPTSTFSRGETSLIKAYHEPSAKEQESDNSYISSNRPNSIQIASQTPKSKLKSTNTVRPQLTRSSGVSKNTNAAKRQLRRITAENTRRTRSQNMTKFYELDANGTTRTYRKFG
ncbi:MAG: hypothetical protein Q9187_006354 [Circinaria calcarea]